MKTLKDDMEILKLKSSQTYALLAFFMAWCFIWVGAWPIGVFFCLMSLAVNIASLLRWYRHEKGTLSVR